ncbi:toprim domain-containing protein [Nonomuraea rubra]|uniref:toprim domain-containing protein n=1 Tax=Nonomuraea rubra TaxID=46180 RepID=UPI00340927D0
MRGSPAEEYLTSRALTPDSIRSFQLGYVADSMPGHEPYAGRLAIPYLSPDRVTLQIRFRRIGDGDGAKYLTVPGDTPRPFNTRALELDSPIICICEGEMDAITATQAALPAIAIPGVSAWRKEWALALHQYDHVFVLADNDDKGQGKKLGETIAKHSDNVRIVLMPEGHDVNSFVQEHGSQALLEKVGINDQ